MAWPKTSPKKDFLLGRINQWENTLYIAMSVGSVGETVSFTWVPVVMQSNRIAVFFIRRNFGAFPSPLATLAWFLNRDLSRQDCSNNHDNSRTKEGGNNRRGKRKWFSKKKSASKPPPPPKWIWPRRNLTTGQLKFHTSKYRAAKRHPPPPGRVR